MEDSKLRIKLYLFRSAVTIVGERPGLEGRQPGFVGDQLAVVFVVVHFCDSERLF